VTASRLTKTACRRHTSDTCTNLVREDLTDLLSPRSRFFTLYLAVLTALTALAIDMSLAAMPRLEHHFGASVATVQLTLSLFLIGFSAGQLVWGPLSDRRGRRPVLLIGLILYVVSGFACSLSISLPMLIACRFLQGIGSSVGAVLARAMVRDYYTPEAAGGILSHITQIMIIAPMVAPTLGGFLLLGFGWQSIFLFLAIAGALTWLVSWRFLAESHPPQAPEAGPTASILDNFRTVLAHRSSFSFVLIICCAGAGLFAYISSSPFVIMQVFHIPQQHYGYYFAMTAGAMMLGATVNRALLPRQGALATLRLGVTLLFAAGMILGVVCRFHIGGIVGFMPPMMTFMFALGLVMPNATASAMAPHGKMAGVSSSVIGSLQTLSSAVSGYIVGSFAHQLLLSMSTMITVMSILTLVTYWYSLRSAAADVRSADEAAELALELVG